MSSAKKVSLLVTVSVLMTFLVQGGIGGLQAAIDGIFQHFAPSGVSLDTVFQLASLPALPAVLGSYISGRLTGDKISYKAAFITGLSIVSVFGAAPFFIDDFTVILITRVVFGFGIGIIWPLANAIVVRLYEGKERGNILGWGNAVATIGGMCLQFFGGVLVEVNWNFAFLVYLLGFVSLLFVFIGLKEPEKTADEQAAARGEKKVKIKLPLKVWLLALLPCVFMLLTYPVGMSASTLVSMRGLGGGVEAGFAFTFFSIGGAVCSIVFGPIYKALQRWTLVVQFVFSIIAMLIILNAGTLWMIFLGMFINGFGLTLVAILMMDFAKLIKPEAVSYAAGIIIVAMNIGTFFASYFSMAVHAIAGTDSVELPLFVGMIGLAILTFILIISRIKPDPKEIGPAEVTPAE